MQRSFSAPSPGPGAIPGETTATELSPAGKVGKVRNVLQERFANGFYRFGQKLSAVELAAEFGVSRQPVMMALRDLRSDGFVIITPQVGCEAASPTKAEIQDFFSVFAKMEGRMAGLAAERHTPEQLQQLTAILERIEAAAHRPQEWDLAWVSHFHETIRQMAHSPGLAYRVGKFWQMANYIIRNGSQHYSEDLHAIGNRERRNILQAISDRDAAFAELLTEKNVLAKPGKVHLL